MQIPMLAEKNGIPAALEETVTREFFEDLIKRTHNPVRRVLEDAGIAKEELDHILLVGGSTRVPLVARDIEALLGKKPDHAIDPDFSVAQGAAIQAGIIAGELDGADVLIMTDVCPYTLGIQVWDGITADCMSTIIPRNTTIPVTKKETYWTSWDYQNKTEIAVYQGESRQVSRNHFLGNFMLEGIPERKAGEESIDVEFSYNQNGILDVKATIVSTHKDMTVTIDLMDSGKKKTDVSEWKQSSCAGEYRTVIRRGERFESRCKKNKEDESKELMLGVPDDPYARKIIGWLQDAMRAQDAKRMVKMAEEAISVCGEAEGFLFYLYRGQNWCGNLGKAIKTMEKLAKRFPDKAYYKKELAISYFDRGYYNKAMTAFRDAYNAGVRDNEFLSAYSINCQSRGEFREGINCLWDLLDQTEKNLKEYMYDALNAFTGLIMMSSAAKSSTDYEKAIQRFEAFIEESSLYLEEYQEELINIVGAILVSQKLQDAPDLNRILKITEKIRRHLSNKETLKIWDEFASYVYLFGMEMDERLSDFTKEMCRVMEPDDEDPEFRRFMQLDVKLRLLEKWPDIRKEFDVVREEYPDSYKFVKDYIKLLNNTADINRLREKLLKDYNRYAVYYEGIPPYYEEYPQRQPKTGEIQWDSDENGAYRRTNKKIGRNDPCPCGSGKKYKNCCGR